MKKTLILALFLWALPMLAQSSTGELRLIVSDPAGLGLKSAVEVVSQGNEYRHTFATDDQGKLEVKRLPYGIYQLQITREGFAPDSESVDVRSALPFDLAVHLQVATAAESVKVVESATLIDPYRAGSVNELARRRWILG